MTKHAEIIARLEALAGPDREVDAMIAVATFVKKHDEWGEYTKMPRKDDKVCDGNYWLHSRSGASLRTSDRYTASLEAAIALCEKLLPGWRWGIDYYGNAHVWKITHCYVTHKSPAIALLVATFKALESE